MIAPTHPEYSGKGQPLPWLAETIEFQFLAVPPQVCDRQSSDYWRQKTQKSDPIRTGQRAVIDWRTFLGADLA